MIKSQLFLSLDNHYFARGCANSNCRTLKNQETRTINSLKSSLLNT